MKIPKLDRLVWLKDKWLEYTNIKTLINGAFQVINCEILSPLYDKFMEFWECHFISLGFSFPMFIMMGLNLLVSGTPSR